MLTSSKQTQPTSSHSEMASSQLTGHLRCRDHFSHYGEIAECVVMTEKDVEKSVGLVLFREIAGQRPLTWLWLCHIYDQHRHGSCSSSRAEKWKQLRSAELISIVTAHVDINCDRLLCAANCEEHPMKSMVEASIAKGLGANVLPCHELWVVVFPNA